MDVSAALDMITAAAAAVLYVALATWLALSAVHLYRRLRSAL